jgi:DegV family protein with EDD domain
MAEKIHIVTDSTASLSPKIAKELGIGVIPAAITFGDKTYLDGVDIGMEKFMEMLTTTSEIPTTGAPSLEEYFKIYRKNKGKIISIHLGSKFSAIFNSSKIASDQSKNFEIYPYDTESLSLGIGFMVIRGVELIDEGAMVEQIIAELDDMKKRTTVMASLNTLEYARKGGRVGHLEFALGSLLQIKPILKISQNKIESPQRPRSTWSFRAGRGSSC